MKRLKLAGFVVASFFAFNVNAQTSTSWCVSHSMSNEVIQNDPEAQKRRQALEDAINGKFRTAAVDTDLRIVPIVFHIIHTGGSENITKAQIEDAVRIINIDYKKQNGDTADVLPFFQSRIGRPNFEFRLATIDPDGKCTDGITRTYSNFHTGASDAAIKGLISWNTANYLNVYCVSNIQSGAGAYAYLPGTWPTGSNRDGIVCRVDQLGSIGQSPGNNFSTRTLTHEIGHYMNLNHTWGPTNDPGLQSNCNFDDDVQDTPNTIGVANQDCNKNFESCGELSNVENYMDYSSCTKMFTQGQVDRMRAAIASNASGRSNLWAPANLIATGTENGHIAQLCVPKADFLGNTVTCINDSLRYKDNSWRGIPTSWEWTFEGGTPATSNLINPVIVYANPGVYKVKLKVSNATGSDSTEKTGYVTVLNSAAPQTYPYSVGFENADEIGKDIFPISDDNIKWERTTAAGATGTASLFLKVFNNPAGRIDAFVLPPLDLTGVTGATMKFKVAHARKNTSTSEELTVSISRNCGATYFNKYSKSGASLATRSDIVTNFVPSSAAHWREETVSLANIQNYYGGLVKFEAISGGGNNIYIDDINITGTTGVENILFNNLNMTVAPNPFSNQTQIRFFLTESAKVSLKVYDILGKEIAVIAQDALNFGDHTYDINESNSGISQSGIYFVRLTVNGFEKTEKIIFTK